MTDDKGGTDIQASRKQITPAEYFSKHEQACSPAVLFCSKFRTMRDAWMSDDVKIQWMLWAVGRLRYPDRGIIDFVNGCLDVTRTHADTARRAADERDYLQAYKNAVHWSNFCLNEMRNCVAKIEYSLRYPALPCHARIDASEHAYVVSEAAITCAYVVYGAGDNGFDGAAHIARISECKRQRDHLRKLFKDMFIE